MNASDINTERLAADLRTITRDAEALLKVVGADEGNGTQDIRQRLTAAIESAKATYHQIEEKAVASAKATDRVIREHPYQTLGVVFGLGILVGVLSARR